MLIDCHAHSCPRSACSAMSAERLCARARERGLDALVLTEHHVQWSRAELDGLEARTPGLRLYGGVELTLTEGYDVVVITAAALEAPWPLSLGRLRRLLAEDRDRSFVFVAHPFRYSSRQDGPIRDILAWADGIEMNSVNVLKAGGLCDGDGLYRPCVSDLYETARREHALAPLFNSDAHREDAVGAVATWLDASVAPADEAELARILRTARREERQDSALLRRLLG